MLEEQLIDEWILEQMQGRSEEGRRGGRQPDGEGAGGGGGGNKDLRKRKRGEEAEVPDSFRCPLTLDIMRDPVLTADGHTYERELIHEWLTRSCCSPLTGQQLPNKDLLTNLALRNSIEEWRRMFDGNSSSLELVVPHRLLLNVSSPIKGCEDLSFEQLADCPPLPLAESHQLKSACIGAGQDKTVYRGILDGKDVAILLVRKGESEHEERILQRLARHPHLVRFCGASRWNNQRLLVTELAKFGSLDVFAEQHRAVLCADREEEEALLFDILFQVTAGMISLHQEDILHRDLALRNILVSSFSSSPLKLQVKVADFGLSRNGPYYYPAAAASSSSSSSSSSSTSFPVRWTAPEALKNRMRFGKKSDVWSFGVMAWELLGYAEFIPYWKTSSDCHVLQGVADGSLQLEKPEGCSDNVWELAQTCMCRSAEERPSFLDVQSLIFHQRRREGRRREGKEEEDERQHAKPAGC